jgi:hypothetical protein
MTDERIRKVRGGIDSLRWLLNNAHNSVYDAKMFDRYKESVVFDVDAALDALDEIEEELALKGGGRTQTRPDR